MSFLTELKRRNVFKVGAAYLVVAWLAVQAASIGFPAFAAPPWVLRVFIFVTLLGFPVALVMAWVLQVTPEGVQVETSATGSKRVFAIAAVLAALAIAWYYQGQPSYKESDPQAQDGPPSIAVLPFANLSGDPAQEFFSDGMTEEILNVLVKIPDLKVAARTSVFAFKGQGGDVREIGRKLGVSYIVEGSVRRDAETLRITAQLIRVADGFHVWSETYDRELKSVFAVQDEIAKRIAGQLKGSLTKSDAPAPRADLDPQAYADYLKARTLYRARESLPEAILLLESVVEREPGFAQAWASLALAHEVAVYFTTPLEREVLGNALARMKVAAAKASDLDPHSAMTLHAVANVARGEGRFVAAEDGYRASMASDPTYPDVREDLSELLNVVGRVDDSEHETEALIALEPYVWIFLNRMGQIAISRRDPAIAERTRKRMAEIAPTLDWGQLYDFRVANARGDLTGAKAAMEAAWHADPSTVAELYGLWLWSQRDPRIDDAAARMALVYNVRDSTFAAHRGDNALFYELLARNGAEHARYNAFADLREAPHLFSDPRTKRILREYGFEAYWRARGWPEQCRPKGDADFECDASFAAARE